MARDTVLEVHDSIPISDVNAQVYVHKLEAQMGDAQVVNHGKSESAAKEVIKKLTQKSSAPYQKRTKSMLCSFYIKGNCKRGEECPFTHEMPEPKIKKSALKKKNVKSSF